MLPYLRKTVHKKKKSKGFGKPFNPNFDGNLLAWYDGDTLATDPANTWTDQSGNGYDLTLFNNPTLRVANINGHDALEFDGINQYGQNLVINSIQPNTYYLVVKQITYTGGDIVFDGRVAGSRNALFQFFVSPDNNCYAGAFAGTISPVLNNYDIISAIFNGVNSEIRLNNAASIAINPGVEGLNGFILANGSTVANPSNITAAYLIIRSAADNTATQNIFINYLKNRFAL